MREIWFFGDDELEYFKAYIESVNPKLVKEEESYSAKASEWNNRRI